MLILTHSRRIALIVVIATLATFVDGAARAEAKPSAYKQTTPNATLTKAVAAAKTQASLLHHRVEVAALDAATETTYANPDGTITSDFTPGPSQVYRNGEWSDIDLALTHVDGGWGPRNSPVNVLFSDGGDKDAVSLDGGADGLDINWAVNLPSPTISGATASYDLGDGETLLLTATAAGFEESLTLNSPPTHGLPNMRIPFQTEGLSLSSDGNGGFDFVDADGTTQYVSPAPTMYDAQLDALGEHIHSQQVSARLVQTVDGPQIDMSPSLAWLEDPATQYPVTIDPTVSSVALSADTYVQDNVTTPQNTSWALYAGEFGGHAERSYIKFSGTTALLNKQITSAALNLYNVNVNSCTPATLHVYPITSPVDTTKATWSNKPSFTTSGTYAAAGTFAAGISACPNASESIDVTNLLSGWAWQDIANYGLQLSGAESAGAQGWAFCSMDIVSPPNNCNSVSREPTLSVTYLAASPVHYYVNPNQTDPNAVDPGATVDPMPDEEVADDPAKTTALADPTSSDTGEGTYTDPSTILDGTNAATAKSSLVVPAPPSAPTEATANAATFDEAADPSASCVTGADGTTDCSGPEVPSQTTKAAARAAATETSTAYSDDFQNDASVPADGLPHNVDFKLSATCWNATAQYAQTFFSSRFHSCYESEYYLHSWITVNGKKKRTGSINWEAFIEVTTNRLSPSAQVTYTAWFFDGWGDYATTVTGAATTFKCFTAAGCTTPDVHSNVTYDNYGTTEWRLVQTVPTPAIDASVVSDSALRMGFGTTEVTVQSDDRDRRRTDNFYRLKGVGTVLPDYTPTWKGLNASDPNSRTYYSAYFVQQAQPALPNWPGVNYPLHRQIDPILINANRAAACSGFVRDYAGDSCDEYPFASTWEGAANNPVKVGHVPLRDNSYAGSLLGAFYQINRIGGGDPFYVEVQ